jgi:hypothetical protein
MQVHLKMKKCIAEQLLVLRREDIAAAGNYCRCKNNFPSAATPTILVQ